MVTLFSTNQFIAIKNQNDDEFILYDYVNEKQFLRLRNERELTLMRKCIKKLEKDEQNIKKKDLLEILQKFRDQTNEDKVYVTNFIIHKKIERKDKEKQLDYQLFTPVMGHFTKNQNLRPEKIIQSTFFAGYRMKDVYKELKKVEEFIL